MPLPPDTLNAIADARDPSWGPLVMPWPMPGNPGAILSFSAFAEWRSFLVLIDHQIGTMQLVKNIASDASLRNAVLLAKAAKTLGMPIVMTGSMEDHLQGPLAPALQQVAPEAFAAHVKRLGIVNAWPDPNFKVAVAATSRKQLVMAGVTTDICLVFPSIDAVDD